MILQPINYSCAVNLAFGATEILYTVRRYNIRLRVGIKKSNAQQCPEKFVWNFTRRRLYVPKRNRTVQEVYLMGVIQKITLSFGRNRKKYGRLVFRFLFFRYHLGNNSRFSEYFSIYASRECTYMQSIKYHARESSSTIFR